MENEVVSTETAQNVQNEGPATPEATPETVQNVQSSDEAAVPTETKDDKPRATKEIQREYQQLCFMLGELEYREAIDKDNKNSLLMRLRYVNNEAAERQALDAAKDAANKANTAKQVQENLKRAEEKRQRKANALNAGATEDEANAA